MKVEVRVIDNKNTIKFINTKVDHLHTDQK